MMSDGAQYVVDVAAQMTGGAQTVAQLDALSARLVGAGVTSENLKDAIAQLSNGLESAASASKAAASALSAGESEYAKLEKAALQAAKAEEKAALTGVVPPEVAASAASATAAVNAYATKLKGLEAEAGAATAKEKSLATALANAKQLNASAAGATEEHAISTRKLSRGLSELGGPLGQLGRNVLTPIRGVQALTEELGGAKAAMAIAAIGSVALTAAVLALAGALIYGTVKTAAWAVSLADSNRELQLSRTAFDALNPKIAAFGGEVDSLAAQTGLGAEAVDKIAKSLTDAHVATSQLPAALEAATLAERALGSGGASEFIQRMQSSGKSVKDFSATTTKQLQGVVAQQMRGLTAQSATFHKNIAGLFGGLNIDPVLTGMQRLVALFDENTVAGQALKFLFEKIFQPLIDQADNASIVIEGFALGFLIGLTKLYIALKPTFKAIASFFGQHDPSLADTLSTVTAAGEKLAPVFVAIAIGVGGALALVGLLVGVSLALAAAFFILPVAIAAAAIWLEVKFLEAVHAVYSFLSSIDLAQVGSDLIAGLGRGIVAGGHAVIDAITGVVGGAITSAKKLLGIASPSKVFALIGENTGEGFAGGVERSSDGAQDALSGLVSPPQSALSSVKSTSSGNTAAATSGASLNFAGAQFTFHGVEGVEDVESRLLALFTKLLEGSAIQSGASEAPA